MKLDDWIDFLNDKNSILSKLENPLMFAVSKILNDWQADRIELIKELNENKIKLALQNLEANDEY